MDNDEVQLEKEKERILREKLANKRAKLLEEKLLEKYEKIQTKEENKNNKNFINQIQTVNPDTNRRVLKQIKKKSYVNKIEKEFNEEAEEREIEIDKEIEKRLKKSLEKMVYDNEESLDDYLPGSKLLNKYD